jgi:predicted dehydrogenase
MTRRLKYGVIGCGHLGRFHAEKVASLEAAELVGVFDIIPEKTTSTADRFHCRPFQSVGELHAAVEAVSVVVPTLVHFEVADRALRAGKHVLLEKPIAATVEQAEALARLAEDHDLKLQIGHIERFNPARQALTLLPEAPRFIEGHRLSQFNPRGLDVAVISELMIHDIDLALSAVASPVKSIHASAVAVVSDCPDIANARLEFENGTVANLTASRISVNKMRKLRLFARDHYLSIDLLKKSGEHFLLTQPGHDSAPEGYFTAVDYSQTGRKILFRSLQYPDIDMLTSEISSFIDAVLNDREVAVTAEDATRALIVAKLIESIADENLNRALR